MSNHSRSWYSASLRATLLAVAVACAAQLLHFPDWREAYELPTSLGLGVAFAAAAAGFGYVAVQVPGQVLRRVACELAVIGIALVLVETAIAIYQPLQSERAARRMQAASRLDIDFDARTRSEVVADLRRAGIDAYPGTGSEWPLVPSVRRRLPAGVYPLSHVGNVTVVECNESGAWHTFATDEWGFNNPPGLISGGGIEVAIVGESYALGHCLPVPESLAGRIRERFPRTANFGMAGTTTVLELAIFREFVEPLRPRVVIWTVNPYFVTAERELRDPVLGRYLDPAFSQDLWGRQDEMDGLVREISIPVEAEFAEQSALREREARRARVLGSWRLPKTREQIRLALPARAAKRVATDLGTFRDVLVTARQAAAQWGGELVVVLLPTYAEVVANQIEPDRRHDSLSRVVTDLGIPVVDGVELFKSVDDPASLYTMRINNHPTTEGYAVLAGPVIDQVRELEKRRQGRAQ